MSRERLLEARSVTLRNRCERDHAVGTRIAREPLAETIECIPARVRLRNGIRWKFENHAQRVHHANPIHLFKGVQRANRLRL